MQTCKLEYTVNSGKRAGGEDAYTPRRNGQTSALKFGWTPYIGKLKLIWTIILDELASKIYIETCKITNHNF